MHLLTLDAETFYGDGYTLSSMTTEEYVRDERFEEILWSIKINNEPTFSVVGADIPHALRQLDIPHAACLFHHAHFDALILSHHHGLRPKLILDTLAMARAEIGSLASRGLSLEFLAQHLGLPPKGDEVIKARNKHLSDFTPYELQQYRLYGHRDVDITYGAGQILAPRFCNKELALIDMTTRMFTEPCFELDVGMLEEYREGVLKHKEFLMQQAGVTREDLMSNERFAGLLRSMGIDPPLKESPTAKNEDGTPKITYAFAKTDEGMKALLEHEDDDVQMLAEARVGVKTTIAESRAKRLAGMGARGKALVYLKYWGAEQTGRHSAADKSNFLNMSRGAPLEDYHFQPGAVVITPDGRAVVEDVSATLLLTSKGIFKINDCHRLGLRDCIKAPPGHVIVVGDSSNIEARMVCYLAGQEDVLDTYRKKGDPYCDMASAIYFRQITKADEEERRLGKVCVLGLGYQMGADKFVTTARRPPWNIDIDEEVLRSAVPIFRNKYYLVAKWWKYQQDEVLTAMREGERIAVDTRGLLYTGKDCIYLPNGRVLRYPNLRQKAHEEVRPDGTKRTKWEWGFDQREGARIKFSKIYGGKRAENDTQAVARIVVMDQATEVAKKYKVGLTVYDEIVCCVPEDEAEACEKFLHEVMSTPPSWAPDFPIACETGISNFYGGAK